MKKSGIALLLTVALILGTILGCFCLPASAEESATISASVISLNASVVGAELQVAVNADGDVSTYKLYEMGDSNTCVVESKYPILVYNLYDSSKSYGVSVVDESGVESVITALTSIDSVAVNKDYNPDNILAGVQIELTPTSASYVHNSDFGKIERLTDGNFKANNPDDSDPAPCGRWSSLGNTNAILDGVFYLGGTFSLGELCLYDFNGTATVCPGAGDYLKICVYSNHEWIVKEFNGKDEILSLRKTVNGTNCLCVDLSGIKAEAIRIVNTGATSSDALSYNEITCSGVFATSYADSNYATFVEDVTEGKVFVPTENCTTPWSPEDKSFDYITDSNLGTCVKMSGPVEMELDLDGDYVMLDSIRVRFELNVANNWYRSGTNVRLEAYYNGEWTEITNHINDSKNEYVTLDLGGVMAQKIRYSTDGIHADTPGDTVSIGDITISGYCFNYTDGLVPGDDVFDGYTFVPTADASSKVWSPYTYDKITDGQSGDNYRFCTQNPSQVSELHADATLDFGGKVASLDTLTVNYGTATRCGKDIIIEVTYRAHTYTVLNHTHTEAVASETFDLGGVLAESVRFYISGSFDTDSIMIREMDCTGAISDFTVSSKDNLIEGVPFETGDTASAVFSDTYGYPTLTDGTSASLNGRFSTKTLNLTYDSTKIAILDGIVKVNPNYDLGELLVYDFTPSANAYFGTKLSILAYVGGSWVEIYNYTTAAEIYAHRSGDHLAFDMKGINASQVRVICENTVEGYSVSVWEIRLTGTLVGCDDEIAELNERYESEYDAGNVLLGIPEENLSVSGAYRHDNATVKNLSNAFDGSLSTRYAVNDLHTAGSYSLTIDLVNPTILYTLSLYDWHDSDYIGNGEYNMRSESTRVELLMNGAWITVAEDFVLDAHAGCTSVDLYGSIATAIRITFTNNSYCVTDSNTSTGYRYPTATLKEITCTGQLAVGDVLDTIEKIENTDTSSVFALDEVKSQKLAEIAADLALAGATDEEILAKIAELETIRAEFEAGYEPVTDAYGDFNSYNISLAGNIGVNFFGDLADDVATQFPNATVVVRYDTVLDGVVTTNTDVLALSDLSVDGTGRYIVNFNLVAAQMTDTVEIRLVLDGNNCGEHIITSIKDYANILINGDYDQTVKDLASAMLTYGAHAQSYFGYNTDNLAAEVTDLTASDDSKISVEGTATGMSMSGWTLMLDTNVTVKTYVTLADGASPEDYTVKVTTPAGEVIENVTLEAVGTRYRVTIEGIASGYLNNNYVITYTNVNDGTAMTVTSSAMCYVSAVLASGTTDTALVNLVKALKLYSVAADAYFGK